MIVLFFFVHIKPQPRRSLDFFSGLTPTPLPLSRNSHGINLFADPHPLNPVASIFYKKMGVQGSDPPSHRFSLLTSPHCGLVLASASCPLASPHHCALLWMTP